MTAVYLLGLMFGVGLLLCVSAFRPATESLQAASARLRRAPADRAAPSTSVVTRTFGDSWLDTATGRRFLKGTDTDLRLCNMTQAEFLAQRVSISLIAALWAPITAAFVNAAGIHVPFAFPAWAALALAPAGFFYPSISLRAKAAARRMAFRHAFGSFLDVISASLAGGKGVESALTDAADAGSGWAFNEMRQELLSARLRGETPWSGLGELGKQLEIIDLQELAASASLAGNEGARVRLSIAAKAKALRLKTLNDIESSAQSSSERMSLPVVALMLGFVLFLGFPAVMAVVNGI